MKRNLLSAMLPPLLGLGMCAHVLGQDEHAKVICVDPGHPSEVGRGAKGKHSTEMQVNFHVAVLLADKLREQGFKVVMTKVSVNRLLTDQRRALIADWAKADLFVRLHCDAGSASGFTVYYPAQAGVSALGDKGPSKKVIAQSAIAARKFHHAMAEALIGELTDNGLKTDAQTAIGAKQGALTGSIYADMPTILVEMVVLTNPSDEKWILKRQNPEKMAEALDRGVLAALNMDQP